MFRGLTVETTLRGKTVAVVFASPFRWQVYDNGINVTAEFDGPFEVGSRQWSAWIREVEAGRHAQFLCAK